MSFNKDPIKIGSLAFLLLALSCSWATFAQADLMDEKLQLVVQRDDDSVGLELTWYIAPGFYMDRNAITATLNGKPVTILTPSGIRKLLQHSASREIYRGIAMANTTGEVLPSEGEISVTYQGCTESSICYPPITRSIDLSTLSIKSTQSEGAHSVYTSGDVVEGDRSLTTAGLTQLIDIESEAQE